MEKEIRILIAEHISSDLELIEYQLKSGGFNYVSLVVTTEVKYIQGLKSFRPDVILSDFTFPAFNGLRAFQLKQELCPETPFIFVSGTVGEEKAVELIKNGVTDYTLKDKLYTLAPKIRRALKEADAKKDKIISDESLMRVMHLYAFISQVNQNIVRVKDEATLFRNACSMAVEFGKFRSAWIGLFENSVRKIKLVEQSGLSPGEVSVFSSPDSAPLGVMDYVIKTGEHYVCNDIQDCALADDLRNFMAGGLKSFLILPIKRDGQVIGLLNLYSEKVNFTGHEETRLLCELVNDISFALDIFERDRKTHVLEKQEQLFQKRIRESEARYRRIVETSQEGIWLIDKDNRTMFVNSKFSEIFGYSPAEMYGKRNLDLMDVANRKGAWARLEMLQKGIGEEFEHEYFGKSGKKIWARVVESPIMDDNGNYMGALVMLNDISEKKLIGQELLESEILNRGILNSLSSHIAVVNGFGEVISVNDSWTRFAADNGETTMARTGEGSNYFKVCERSAAAGDSTALSALAGMKDVLEGRSGMFNLEYPCHAPNELRWFNMRVTKFENNQSMIVVAHENISERKLAEENLLKNEFHLKEAQSIALLGNWSTDFATGKGIWSEEACRIYGIDTAENVQTNKNWLSFVHPDDLQGVLDSIRETKETLSNPTLYYRIVLKNGTMKHIQSKSKFEFNSQGQPTGMYGIIMDITERKQTEDEREKMIVNIVEHSKKLEQFTFIVSHNLRSPVAHILGLANVMKTSITEEDRLRSQEYLFTATRQLDEIMQDLNMILQLRSSDGDYDEVIKLESLVDGIMKGLGNFPEKDSVQVITDFTAVKEITAIKSYMYSIFLNLISNSIKYRKPESPSIIHIRTSLQKNRVIISFRDNGIGINLAKHSGDIFGLYKRFHFHVKGKGLGLFMVRTQVESLGGTIRIDSMEGEGTGFTIEIPA